MATEAVGGYWATLELKTKEEDFKKGIKRLKEVKETVKHFAEFAVKSFSLASGGLLALTAATASYETQNAKVAYSLRMSSSELVAWKNTANIMGVSAEGLTGALESLQRKSDRIKLGEIDVGLAKSLGMLGVGYQSFLKQDTSSKMKTVFEKAMSMTDKGKAGELIRDVLGDSGKEMFEYMEMTGQSLDSILSKSKALMFTTDSTRKQAMIFNQEFKATFGSFKEMGSLFFSTFGGAMTPVLKNLQTFIIRNKTLIASGIVKFAKDLAKISKDVFKAISTGVPFVVKLVDKLGGLEGVLKKVVVVFGIMLGLKVVGGLASMLGALTGLSKMRIAGAMLGFVALALVLQDIALYMEKGDKADTYTQDFLNWLDKIGEKTHWVKALSDALKGLLEGLKDFQELMKVLDKWTETGKNPFDWKQNVGIEKGEGHKKFQQKTSSNLRQIELLSKPKWSDLEAREANDLGLRESQKGNKDIINNLEVTLKGDLLAQAKNLEIQTRYNSGQIQKRVIR